METSERTFESDYFFFLALPFICLSKLLEHSNQNKTKENATVNNIHRSFFIEAVLYT